MINLQEKPAEIFGNRLFPSNYITVLNNPNPHETYGLFLKGLQSSIQPDEGTMPSTKTSHFKLNYYNKS